MGCGGFRKVETEAQLAVIEDGVGGSEKGWDAVVFLSFLWLLLGIEKGKN